MFLTAKGKFVDTYEWHSLAAGILASSFYYMPIEFSTEISYLFMTAVGCIALGIEVYRVKEETSVSVDVLGDKVATLKDQIGKEGHYGLLGLIVPHASAELSQYVPEVIAIISNLIG